MTNQFTTKDLTIDVQTEAQQLHERLAEVNWGIEACEMIAPLTLEINRLKREMNAVVLAHSYQTPDIIFGIADFTGDSLGLSKEAAKTPADTIIFCGVRFMAETAKILSPSKRVLLPAPNAGCSLAEAITAEDVKKLKAQYPGVPVVCYVNTNADVKAESDACCTSGNALEVVNAQPGDKVIFIPDKLMAANLRSMTDKEMIEWNGTCIVHEEFNPKSIDEWKKLYPDMLVLAHTECDSSVVEIADMAGSTEGMIKFIKESNAERYMLITECGLSDRLRVEFEGKKKFFGSCVLCPYMKQTELPTILECMKNPSPDQIVELDYDIIRRARRSIDQMLAH